MMKNDQRFLRLLVDHIPFEIDEEFIHKRASNCLLAHEDRRAPFYDSNKHAYVFDQPADVFEVLLYFISTGLFSRPMNVDPLKLYSLLVFFEVDQIVIENYKQMEHLVFEINWETREKFDFERFILMKHYFVLSSIASWWSIYFTLPITAKAKLMNTFFFAITMISYGNLCFQYAFALPMIRSNTSDIIGLDFSPSIDRFSSLLEMIYLTILIIEFSFRFHYSTSKRKYFVNYLTIIDLLAIISCFLYLISTLKTFSFIQFITCFRFIRILKLSRYSTFIRHYFQTLFFHYRISILLFIIFFCLCTFFGYFIYGLSLFDRQRISLTPMESLFYIYETILTIGFGIHLPSSPYLEGLILISVLVGMICLSLVIPLIGISNFNLNIYEQEQMMIMH